MLHTYIIKYGNSPKIEDFILGDAKRNRSKLETENDTGQSEDGS